MIKFGTQYGDGFEIGFGGCEGDGFEIGFGMEAGYAHGDGDAFRYGDGLPLNVIVVKGMGITGIHSFPHNLFLVSK